MKKEIIAEANMHEVRVAILEDGDLAEIIIEPRGQERLMGNIYKGRVENILPGMQAAFVNIGLSKNTFLYAGDVFCNNMSFHLDQDGSVKQKGSAPTNIKEMLQVGQEITVQVTKQQGGTKGARVTMHITLPSRRMVLMPTVDHVGVSRRIASEQERDRLKSLVCRIKPSKMGVIVRTAAEGATEEELVGDIEFLSRLWERIKRKSGFVSAPRLIHAEEPLIMRTVRDSLTPDVEQLIIDDKEYYQQILAFVGITQPEMKDRIFLYDKEDCIFDNFNIEAKINKALQRRIWLKSGSYLVIDETEALTAIDVNTGKFTGDTNNLQETILKTNLEAAKEIAKQLRLRDIGGIVIIDFIDMDNEENRKKVVEALREALKRDRTKTNVVGMTELGLVEMTRKKMRRTLSSMVSTTCPHCNGSGKVISIPNLAMRLRRDIIRATYNSDMQDFLVEVSPQLAAYIAMKNANNESILPTFSEKRFYFTENKLAHFDDICIHPVIDTRTLIKLGKDAQRFF